MAEGYGLYSEFFEISAEPATVVFDSFFHPSQPALLQINQFCHVTQMVDKDIARPLT